jgi:dolichol-phosphate mannosyltransferase
VRAIVVVPTYNEVDNIDTLISGLAELDEAFSRDEPRVGSIDVVVVDDSSPDGTAERVGKLAEKYRPGMLNVLVRPRPEGLAPAYRAGFAWALRRDYQAVVQMDADGSHPTAVVPVLLRALDGGADLALGARYIPGGSTDPDWAWHRKALSVAGNTYARLVLGLPYRDLTGGFKAWKTDLLASISPVGGTLSGYAFQIHSTYAAHRRGARIVEVPFKFKERVHGTSKMHGRIISEGLSAVVTMRLRPPLGLPDRPTR